jgi:hypothetical protein
VVPVETRLGKPIGDGRVLADVAEVELARFERFAAPIGS